MTSNDTTATQFYPTWNEANRHTGHGQEVKMGPNGQGQQMYYVADKVTTPRPSHIPADQWDAMTDDERQAMGEWETKMGRAPRPVPTATYNTISGVTSNPLYGPRATWARQIKSWYPSVDHVHVDSRRTVRATHPGSEAFTLGFVTVHPTTCAALIPTHVAGCGCGYVTMEEEN